MSIEKITAKIVNDAKEEADKLLDEERTRVLSVTKEAKAKAEAILESSKTKGTLDKEKLILRKKSVADIDGKKLILKNKQELIGKCFDLAVEKIISMDEEKYIDFLLNTIKKTGELKGEIIMNPKERASIGDKFVLKIKETLPKSQIVLSDETRDIKGGFMLKNELVYINGTVEALVLEAKDDLALDVSKKLFSKG